MNFSTNQVRQAYVVKAVSSTAVTDGSAVGTISVHSNAGGNAYFLYRGVDGVQRSDLIKKSQVTYTKATDAEDLARPLKKKTVVLDSSVNSGNIVAGEEYVLRIVFRNYIGLSEEDQYFKHGVVHGVTGMTASQFYAKMALSLAKNFQREPSKVLKFYVRASGGDTEVLPTTLESSLSGTYTALVIEEAEQEWRRGTFESVSINYTVQPTTIKLSDGLDYIWGTVADIPSTTFVGNGKVTADLEYFLMGERGDEYRMVGFPKVIHTEYQVDPTLEYNYVDIHHYYAGDGEAVHKSEKDMTFIIPKVGVTNSVSNILANDLIDDINSALGVSIATLDTSA